MDRIAELTACMAEFNAGEPALTHHLVKVHGFARTIGALTGLDAATLEVLELAALTHDIGIGPCLAKYGACTGDLQEKEGPQHARPMLEALGVAPAVIDRVCYLIAHHHTLDPVDGPDHRILLEADLLVNAHEGNPSQQAKRTAYEATMRTVAGKRLFMAMFGEP